MPIVKYQNGDTGLLKELCKNLRAGHGLRYSPFVDYYYTNNRWADLNLLVDENTNAVLGILGCTAPGSLDTHLCYCRLA